MSVWCSALPRTVPNGEGAPEVGTKGSPLLRAAYTESAQWIGPDGDLAYPLTPTAALARAEDLAVSEPGTVTGGQVQGSQRYQTLTLLRPGSVTISRVWIDFSPPLVRADDHEGWFFSSSEDLNRIWFDGAYTTQMNQLAPGTPGREPKDTSDKPLLLDGAKRDRAVWSGDLVVQGPTLLYSTWDLPYLRSSLELLASYQNSKGAAAGVVSPLAPLAEHPAEGIFPITGEPYSATYSMYVILGLEIYHRFTGDVDAIEAQWPMIERQLEYNRSLVDDRALLVTADRSDALDWDYYDGPKVGAVTAYNVLYSATLRSSARLAEVLGRDRGRQLMTEADTLDAAINEYLWDDQRGAYLVADTIPGLAQDANALAIVHGVACPDKHPRILSALRDQLWTTPFGPLAFTSDTGFEEYVSPFASGMEVRARFAAGDTLGAIELIEDLWGHMSAPGPNATGTHWEVLTADGTPALGGYTSLAHGWATTATGALSAYVLGIRPISAGFSDWTMAPHPGDLDWAEGRVPTPDGPIDARWVSEADTLTATVVAPEGTRGTIALPATEGRVGRHA